MADVRHEIRRPSHSSSLAPNQPPADLRNSLQDYTNTSSLLAQVNSIKSRKNLLLWCEFCPSSSPRSGWLICGLSLPDTADEPDGSSDAQNATRIAYEATNAADGYHPVSLVRFRSSVVFLSLSLIASATGPGLRWLRLDRVLERGR